MKNRIMIAAMVLLALSAKAQDTISSRLQPKVIVSTDKEPLISGKFSPDWESLSQYETPEWFKNAKFGIWAHWGPQCAPEAGDWYARHMYHEGHWQNKFHIEKYGHPSEFGFKDVINSWKAENWNPDQLVALYKRAGAQYFFAMGNHHDNLDMWDSQYQPWNSVDVGPKKNIIQGWADAAKKQDLPFGISIHAAHAYTWYEGAQGADKSGDKAGVPYDGTLTKADGAGTWWEGLDPQDLYAQNHPHSEGWGQSGGIHGQWNWQNGAALPDQYYSNQFYNRTMDVIKKYHPDLIYFDDTALPLWPVSDAGLKIVSNYYNLNMQENNGKLDAVVFGKILTDDQRDALVWDIERGAPNDIQSDYWQTCTCIGGWHYDRGVYNRGDYKSGKTVIQMLSDIVSKNGNLLLNIPVRSDGTIDEKEVAVLEYIAAWMDVNKEAIFDTRVWKIFGEGPASEGVKLSAQGFNEGKGKAFTAEDVRFTQKDKVLYAIIMESEGTTKIDIKSLALGSDLLKGKKIKKVSLLGSSQKLKWKQTADGLHTEINGGGVKVLKIEGIL